METMRYLTVSNISDTYDNTAIDDITHNYNTIKTPIRVTGHPPTVQIELIWYGYLMTYLPVFVWIWGTISNILAFLMFLKKGMRENVTALLFRSLAVIDFLALQETLTVWLQNLLGQESTALHTWGCRVGFFLMKSFKALSAWILVLVSVERFIGVCFPHQAKMLVTKTRAKMALVLIFFMVVPFFVPCLLMYANHVAWSPGLHRNDYTCLRDGNPHYKHFGRYVFPWLEFFVTSGIPFLWMVVLNSAIIVTLVRAAHMRSKTTSGDVRGPDTSAMTAMLLGISVAFILLTAPMCVYFLFYNTSHPEKYPIFRGKLRLLFSIAFNLQHANHSINFCLYCLTGTRFRQEVINTIKYCFRNRNFLEN